MSQLYLPSQILVSCPLAELSPFCRYPSVVWSPCTPHCLDLFLEDIGKLEWANAVVLEGFAVVKCVTNHGFTFGKMAELSPDKKLLKPGACVEQPFCYHITIRCTYCLRSPFMQARRKTTD